VRGAATTAAACAHLVSPALGCLPLRSCREAYCSTGYSPVLAFDVDDLQSTLVRCLEQGATMDGSIQHSPHGKASSRLRGKGEAGWPSGWRRAVPFELGRLKTKHTVRMQSAAQHSPGAAWSAPTRAAAPVCSPGFHAASAPQVAALRAPDGVMISLMETIGGSSGGGSSSEE
jgi:hypothetical protein